LNAREGYGAIRSVMNTMANDMADDLDGTPVALAP
jgi:hypothetical protein